MSKKVATEHDTLVAKLLNINIKCSDTTIRPTQLLQDRLAKLTHLRQCECCLVKELFTEEMTWDIKFSFIFVTVC